MTDDDLEVRRLAEQGATPIPLFPEDADTADPAQVSLFGFPLEEAAS